MKELCFLLNKLVIMPKEKLPSLLYEKDFIERNTNTNGFKKNFSNITTDEAYPVGVMEKNLSDCQILSPLRIGISSSHPHRFMFQRDAFGPNVMLSCLHESIYNNNFKSRKQETNKHVNVIACDRKDLPLKLQICSFTILPLSWVLLLLRIRGSKAGLISW